MPIELCFKDLNKNPKYQKVQSDFCGNFNFITTIFIAFAVAERQSFKTWLYHLSLHSEYDLFSLITLTLNPTAQLYRQKNFFLTAK